MLRVDLHTHSLASKDGGLSLDDYQAVLDKKLDFIAITDHDEIDFALEAFTKIGDRIIVGQEISSKDGEIIGLYLESKIEPKQTAEQTIKDIKQQGGLVYIPHPLSQRRDSLGAKKLANIIQQVDIIELYNGRTYQLISTSKITNSFNVPFAASSDAHGPRGIGRTYSMISSAPTKNTLVKLIDRGQTVYAAPSLMAILEPTKNRLDKRFRN